jgi:hypothetical protein
MSGDRSTNLMYQRANGSVWDKRGWNGPTVEERLFPWVVGAAGAAVVAFGARRRSWSGAVYVMSGLTMWTCATNGMCNPRYASARLDHLLRQRRKDRVTKESMHSFPASDPPSFTTAATTTGLRVRTTGPRVRRTRAAAELVTV